MTNPNIVDGKEKLKIFRTFTEFCIRLLAKQETGFIADRYGDIELTSGRLGFSDVVYSKPTAELDSAKDATLYKSKQK